MVGYGVEHLSRLGQIDVEQLGVEPAHVGRKQPLRLFRYFGSRRNARVGDHFHCGGERLGASRSELLQCRIDLCDQIDVTDQLGIIAKSGQLTLQVIARCRVARRVVNFGDELR